MQQLLEQKYHFVKVESAQPSILDTKGVIFQRKYDGVSAEVTVNEEIRIVGRGITKGRDSNYTNKFPELVQEIKNLNLPQGTDFLPEIIVINKQTGKEDLKLVQTRTGRDNNIGIYANLYPAIMIVHDIISIGKDNVTQLPYLERLEIFKKYYLFGKSNSIFTIGNSFDGRKQWEAVEQMGLEGLIIRDDTGHKVLKLKREITEDVFCFGEFEPSTSDTNSNLEYVVDGVKKKGVFANLVCYQIIGRQLIRVCDVGTGFSQEQKKLIQIMIDSGKISKNNPLVMEIKANDRHESGKLRHPRFIRIRDDKPWEECIVCLK